MTHLEEVGVVGKEEPLASARRAVWSMLNADDAGIVSKSAQGLAKVMTVIVTVFDEACLTASKKKIESMLQRRLDQTPPAPSLKIKAAGQRYKQMTEFLYLDVIYPRRR